MRPSTVLAFLWALLVLASGCLARSRGAVAPDVYLEEMPSADGGYDVPMASGFAAPASPSRSKSAARRVEAAPASSTAEAGVAGVVAGNGAPTGGAGERMVHYDGHAVLQVARPDQTADRIVEMATEAGGRLEAMGPDFVRVRVPVAGFEGFFAAVLELGEVVDRSITASDVTEAFTATDLRLRTARATRDRLVALLARAVDEQEKLRLVQEIQRVTEEIDRLEASVRTLRELAALSRVTVELRQRPALAWAGEEDDAAEFAWVRQLSPFGEDLLRTARPLRLDVPEGMVALAPRGPFVAESADGARLWTGRLPNEPRGDADFWIDALRRRLAEGFATAEVIRVGSFAVLRLVDRADEPYTWMVGVRPEGRTLHVFEVFYPTAEQEERYRDAVAAVLGGGAS